VRKFRVKVFVRGTTTRVVSADNEEDAQRVAEDTVDCELPSGFGGLVRASKPKAVIRRSRRR